MKMKEKGMKLQQKQCLPCLLHEELTENDLAWIKSAIETEYDGQVAHLRNDCETVAEQTETKKVITELDHLMAKLNK